MDFYSKRVRGLLVRRQQQSEHSTYHNKSMRSVSRSRSLNPAISWFSPATEKVIKCQTYCQISKDFKNVKDSTSPPIANKMAYISAHAHTHEQHFKLEP